jgi:hypothetical protein
VLGGSCRYPRGLLPLRHCNGFPFNKLLAQPFGWPVASTSDDNRALKSKLAECRVGEYVEGLGDVTASDSAFRRAGARAGRGKLK